MSVRRKLTELEGNLAFAIGGGRLLLIIGFAQATIQSALPNLDPLGLNLVMIVGGLLFVALAALWLWLGWMFYKARPAGWWILVAVMLLLILSNVLTFTRVDLIEMLVKQCGHSLVLGAAAGAGLMNSLLMAFTIRKMISATMMKSMMLLMKFP